MNEREGLLKMLEWGENDHARNPKHEWLEEPLGDPRGVRRRRENLLQTFARGTDPAFAQKDLERNVAHTAICGKSNLGANPSEQRRMSGLVELIRKGDDPVIIDCMGGVLSMDILRVAMDESWTRGGGPSVLLAGPGSLFSKATTLPKKKGEAGTIDPTREWASYAFVTDFGIVDVVPCIFVPPGLALLVDPSRAFLVTMKGSDPLQVTLEIQNAGDGGHALIQNFAL